MVIYFDGVYSTKSIIIIGVKKTISSIIQYEFLFVLLKCMLRLLSLIRQLGFYVCYYFLKMLTILAIVAIVAAVGMVGTVTAMSSIQVAHAAAGRRNA